MLFKSHMSDFQKAVPKAVHRHKKTLYKSSTLRSESGKRTYSITARRMISELVSKYLNGERFVIRQGYETALPVSSSCGLTVPFGTFNGLASHNRTAHEDTLEQPNGNGHEFIKLRYRACTKLSARIFFKRSFSLPRARI